QRPLDGGGLAASARGGVDCAGGLAGQAHLRKQRLIGRIGDEAAEVVGVGLRQFRRIRNANPALRWVVAEIPGRQRDGGDDRLQVALKNSIVHPLWLSHTSIRTLE